MKFLFLLALLGYVAAQTTVLPIRRVVVNSGKYQGYNDGKYHPDNSGRYSGDNGKYVHDDKGYVHQEPLYVEKPQPKPQIVYIQPSPAPTPVYVQTFAPTTFAPTTQAPTTAAPTTLAPVTQAPEPVKPLTVIQYIQKPTLPPQPPTHYTYIPYEGQNNYNDQGRWLVVRHVKEANLGGYNYAFDTENKISAQEIARLTADDGHLRANGFYEYVGDNGVVYRVDYLADENGFQPIGAHIPREWVETLSTF